MSRSAKLLVLCGLTLAGALAAEVVFRCAGRWGLVNAYHWRDVQDTSLLYDWSALSRHTLRRQERTLRKGLRINRFGYRGPPVDPRKPPEVYRIAFLGGSQVFNFDARNDDDWPHRTVAFLEQQLGRRIECLNAGTPGYATHDSLGKLYGEIHLFELDMVVVCHAWNDLKYFPVLSRDNSLVAQSTNSLRRPAPNRWQIEDGWDKTLFGWSKIYAKLIMEAGGKNPIAEGLAPRCGPLRSDFDVWGPRQYELNLCLIAEVCRRIGARLVLLKQVTLATPDNTPEEKSRIAYPLVGLDHQALCRAYRTTYEVLDRVAEQYANTTVIDVTDSMNGDLRWFSDHVHLNRTGSRRLADLLAGKLARVIPPPAEAPQAISALRPPKHPAPSHAGCNIHSKP